MNDIFLPLKKEYNFRTLTKGNLSSFIKINSVHQKKAIRKTPSNINRDDYWNGNMS